MGSNERCRQVIRELKPTNLAARKASTHSVLSQNKDLSVAGAVGSMSATVFGGPAIDEGGRLFDYIIKYGLLQS